LILAAGGGIDLLVVNPGLMIWTLITFLIVVFILSKFAWKPIIAALDARANKIHDDLEKAEKLKTEAETALANYKEQIAKAKDEANAIISAAKTEGINLKNKLNAETQAEVKAQKEQAINDIELSKTKAVQELQEYVVDLSVAIAGQILEKNMKAEEHTAYVKSEIARLKNVKVS
jgi:F-type H+-transporting ATPase subunit b